MMNERALQAATSSKIQNWGTPWDFFAWQRWCWRFTIDACAEAWNKKLKCFWSAKENGLAQPWRKEIVWDNPEYSDRKGRPIVGRWLKHAKHEAVMGGVSVNLVASRHDTDWWRTAVEADNGPLARSYFVPETRVWWCVWRDLLVGTYDHDERLEFDAPPGAVGKDGNPMQTSGALFPSALLIFAARARHRMVKVQPAPRLMAYAPRGSEAAGNKLIGYPLLTYGMPE